MPLPYLPEKALLGTMVGVTLLATSLGCNHRPLKTARQQPLPPAADRSALAVGAVVAPGIVEPWGDEVKVAAKEAGWIAEVLVVEGQAVKTGDLLARLDSGPQAAGVQMAVAEVAELEALLARSLHGSTIEEVAQAKGELEAATARAWHARAEAQRLSALMREGLVAQSTGERALRDAQAETAGAAALDARYRAVVRGSRSEDVAIAQRRLEAARARLTAAQAVLDRRGVVAPVAGTVLWSRYRPGEFYTPGAQALFVVGDLSRYQIRIDVDEIDEARVAFGSQVTIRRDGSVERCRGKVVSLSPRMGRKNLLVETPTVRNDVRIREVLVEAPAGGFLLPGLRVWVEFGSGDERRTAAVPTQSPKGK